jgi:4-hydroxy 2-oxovalerate aldolase
MNNTIKILDCTFRDGGYYNKWDFDISLVHKYLYAMKDSGIDVIELGFRNFSQNEFFGAFAYTTDTYIDALNLDDNTFVSVMIDASSILNSGMLIDKAIERLFKPKDKSKVSLVRIASHFDTANQCKKIAQELRALGYQVGLNLMWPYDKSDKETENSANNSNLE